MITRHAGSAVGQRAGGLDAVAAGHLDVQQRDVRPVLAGGGDDFVAAADLGDDLDVVLEVQQGRSAPRTSAWSSASSTRITDGPPIPAPDGSGTAAASRKPDRPAGPGGQPAAHARDALGQPGEARARAAPAAPAPVVVDQRTASSPRRELDGDRAARRCGAGRW